MASDPKSADFWHDEAAKRRPAFKPWKLKGSPHREGLMGRRFSKQQGAHLAAVRIAQGVTLSELAYRLSIPRARVRSYELGAAAVNPRMLVRWAYALRVQPGELMPLLDLG